MDTFIDHHTHSKRCDNSIIEVISLHDHQERDCFYFTRGFHPWWTFELLTQDQISYLSDQYLKEANCLAIGECGLDKLKGADLEMQEQIFIQQIQVANAYDAPLVVHCVRAYDRIIRLRKMHAKTDWVIHGFVRNAVLANQLIDAGFYLSVAPHHEMQPSFAETLRSIPMDRLFIETDSSTAHDIVDRYQLFASVRNMELEAVKKSVFNNFKNFYKNKWKFPSG
jgi:TatD DNase family protein